jgi:hypothetical protein
MVTENRQGQSIVRNPEDSTLLAASAVRVGAAWPTYGFAKFRAFASSDVAGTLSVLQSDDGTTWFTTVAQAVAADATAATIVESIVTKAFVRARYLNGAGAQGQFNFSSALVGV